MSTHNKKISFLGLALSLTLVATGCGRGFEANKGKAGLPLSKPTTTADQVKKPSAEELANQALARAKREDDLRKSSKEGAIVDINDQANLYITGASLARVGEDKNQQVVFSAIVKENSADNKASVEITAQDILAKISAAADGKAAILDASQITFQTLKGTKTEVAPKPEEYTLTVACQDDCSEVIVRMQRKGEAVAYAAEFTFTLSEDQREGTLAASSLTANDQVPSFEKALLEAGVETEKASSETTGEAKAEENSVDTEKQTDATKTDEAKTEDVSSDAGTDTAAAGQSEEKPAASPEDPAAKAAVDAAVTAEGQSAADAKTADDASKIAEMTVDESGKKADEAGQLAQAAAAPQAKPSKERLQITRDITVKKAQVVRLNAEMKTAQSAMNLQRAKMWKASSDLKSARLEYEKLNKGMSNFFGTNSAAKRTAQMKIEDKTRFLNAQLKDLSAKIKTLGEKVKATKTALSQLNTLKSKLATSK